MHEPTHDDIVDAARLLAGHAFRTPVVENAVLNARTNGRVLLKLETLQRVGAFKFRGAYNTIARLDRARFPGGVVACSSGNHAQGVAEAARLLGHAAVLVMPSDAPRIKVERTQRSGGEVVLYDREREDRDLIANERARSRGAAMVHPYDHPHVIAGQGTVGLELMQQARDLGAEPDLVLVPCSGGGLASGIALAVKQARPATEVYAVEPDGFDDLARSLAAGKRLGNERKSGSICDALQSQSTGALTFPLLRRLLAGGITVTDDAVRDAVRYAATELKLVVEPGGAVGLAAILSGAVPVAGRTAVVVLSGGNIDPVALAALLRSD